MNSIQMCIRPWLTDIRVRERLFHIEITIVVTMYLQHAAKDQNATSINCWCNFLARFYNSMFSCCRDSTEHYDSKQLCTECIICYNGCTQGI